MLAAGGSIIAAVALFAGLTIVLTGHELRSSLDSALRTRAEDVAQLAVSAPAVLSEPGALESPVSGRQIVVEVLDSHGRILARSLTLGARLLPVDRLARGALVSGRAGYEDVGVSGRNFRLYAAPIAQAGGPASGGAVLVASDTTDIGNTISHLGVVLALVGGGVALLAFIAAGVLTGRGLRPLRRLALAAGEIEQTADPARRLPSAGSAADEIGQLTGVLNRMLASLERSREAERRFLADASHELRTPVAALLGNAEFAARHGASEEVLSELERDAARLARLVDQLLALERESTVVQEPATVSLQELAHAAVRDRVRLGAVKPVRVRGERESLARALDNLIENGLVHGPADGMVTVGVSREGDVALISVSDEGEGPAAGDRERLFERFWRAPSAAGDRPGSGLGLSIVAAIVARHGGRVTVEGSRFTIELPAAGG